MFRTFSNFCGLLFCNLRVTLIPSLSSLIITSFLFYRNKRGVRAGSRGVTNTTLSGTMKLALRFPHIKQVAMFQRERGKSTNYQNLPASDQEMLATSPFFRLESLNSSSAHSTWYCICSTLKTRKSLCLPV